MNEKMFQGRHRTTGEPVGMMMKKATEVVAYLRKMGYRLAECEVEMMVKQPDGTYRKDVSCPALAVR